MIAPKLRFSEFKDDLEKEKLYDLTLWSSGGTPSKANEEYWNGEIPLISGASMHTDKLFKSDVNITELGLKKGSKLAPKNSILILVRGSMLFNKIPLGIATDDVAFNQDVKCIRVKEKLSPLYLFQWFKAKEFTIQNKVTATGIGAGKLDTDDLQNLEIYLPIEKEQTKIAEFLSAVDDKISQLSRQLELLNQYKKGVMQKIFSQEIRFKNDNGEDFGEWDYLQLDEVLDYEQPTKYIVESTEYDNIFQTPVLTAGKSFILGYTNETNGIFEAKKENVIIFDDFTTAYKFVDFDFKVKSSAMKILKVKNENFDIRYIYATFSLLQLPLGDEHKRRWISEYSLQEIPVPTIQEQKKIAEFLTAIDERIDHTTAQLTHTKHWKKGLLQQMFI